MKLESPTKESDSNQSVRVKMTNLSTGSQEEVIYGKSKAKSKLHIRKYQNKQ